MQLEPTLLSQNLLLGPSDRETWGIEVGTAVAKIRVKGQLAVPQTVYPWYLLSSLGIPGDYNP